MDKAAFQRAMLQQETIVFFEHSQQVMVGSTRMHRPDEVLCWLQDFPSDVGRSIVIDTAVGQTPLVYEASNPPPVGKHIRTIPQHSWVCLTPRIVASIMARHLGGRVVSPDPTTGVFRLLVKIDR